MHKNKYDKTHNETTCTDTNGTATTTEVSAVLDGLTALTARVVGLETGLAEIQAQLGSLSNGVGVKPTPAPEGDGVPADSSGTPLTPAPADPEVPTPPTVPAGTSDGASDITLEPGQSLKVSAKQVL